MLSKNAVKRKQLITQLKELLIIQSITILVVDIQKEKQDLIEQYLRK
jgi:hypothetical protein